ncbi:hypothetical protein BN14_00028 [Rhizoctonia solani AG-1 IB]|uniref:Uncharacterized protein n=1 Tax=Thanatephorus cucumeris (strain AG1-IB / isolate 7/3/14) TaxID=1108050 RepID=M5BHN7_THACB|nr:hypothetical protein BN14_00028 [Rhizoctonia solani AG-1 IB]
MAGGDDLDDGLVLEPSFLTDAGDDGPTLSVPLDEESEFRLESPPPVASKKRKRPENSPVEPKVMLDIGAQTCIH